MMTDLSAQVLTGRSLKPFSGACAVRVFMSSAPVCAGRDSVRYRRFTTVTYGYHSMSSLRLAAVQSSTGAAETIRGTLSDGVLTARSLAYR
eukprot:313690-Hanusia_phi.AAC.2